MRWITIACLALTCIGCGVGGYTPVSQGVGSLQVANATDTTLTWIRLRGGGTAKLLTVEIPAGGTHTVPGLKAGTYEVEAHGPWGYQVWTYFDVRVPANGTGFTTVGD